MHLFISYSRKDTDFALYLRSLLEHAGFPVWMDARLSTGENFASEIKRNIDTCAAFIVVMSPESEESDWVQNEIIRAKDQRKPLFPVLLRGNAFWHLANVQYEDMRAGLTAIPSSKFWHNLQVAAGASKHFSVDFEIFNEDAMEFACDVLMLKYARSFYGADLVASIRLQAASQPVDEPTLKAGTTLYQETMGAMTAPHVLFIPTVQPRKFGYQSVRELGEKTIQEIARLNPYAEHIAMTIHGMGFRLDEVESLKSQLAGLIAGLQNLEKPIALKRISILEKDVWRARLLQESAKIFFEELDYAVAHEKAYRLNFERGTRQASPDAGKKSDAKPFALALVDQNADLEDVFYYGIQRPVHARGWLCERLSVPAIESQSENPSADFYAFLGHIAQAQAFICDLSALNLRSQFVLGYLWGKGVPIVFLSANQGDFLYQEVLHYQNIRQVEEGLAQRLDALAKP